MSSLRIALGVNELTDKKSNLVRALVAEFLGTMMLNFFGCGSVASSDNLAISFSFGLTVTAAIQAIGHVSGGHINPAVTVGLMAIGKVPVIRAILYIVAQSVGAIVGSAVLRALSGAKLESVLGFVFLKGETTPVQGFGVEFFLAFVLVIVVCGACDPGKPETKGIAPLIIGLTVVVGHIVGIPRTNTGMNPARALGSAVITGQYDDHWLYWAGPLLGGAVAALVYQHIIGHAKIVQLPRSYTTVNTEEKELQRLNTKEDHQPA